MTHKHRCPYKTYCTIKHQQCSETILKLTDFSVCTGVLSNFMQLPAAVYHGLQIIRLSKSLQGWEAFNFHTVLNLSEVQVYNCSAPVLSKLPSVEKKRVRDNSCERSTTMTHSGLIAFSFLLLMYIISSLSQVLHT